MKKSIAAVICTLLVSAVCFAGPQKDIRTVVFDTYLHCENCVKKVQENIAFEKGVKDLDVSLKEQKITVSYDAAKTSEEKLRTAIEKLGYKAEQHKEEKSK